jgi:hypothetical protein
LVDFPPPKVSNGWLRAHTHCVYQYISRVNIKLPKKELEYIPSFEDGHKVQSSLNAFTNYNSYLKLPSKSLVINPISKIITIY